MTATVSQTAGRLTPDEAAEYDRRFRALGWTQNETARRIGKDPGLFSRWLRCQFTSSVIRRKLDRALEKAEAKAANGAAA